jgi:hypothetical protein
MSAVSWSKERLEQLQALRNEGYSYSRIGRMLGCSRNAAIGAGKRWGVVGNVVRVPRVRSDDEPLPERELPSLPEPEPVYEGAKHTHMKNLGSNQCRYPLWGTEGGAPNFECCGRKGFPWCDHHRAIIKGKRVA